MPPSKEKKEAKKRKIAYGEGDLSLGLSTVCPTDPGTPRWVRTPAHPPIIQLADSNPFLHYPVRTRTADLIENTRKALRVSKWVSLLHIAAAALMVCWLK
jgi:hypothetical protein